MVASELAVQLGSRYPELIIFLQESLHQEKDNQIQWIDNEFLKIVEHMKENCVSVVEADHYLKN